MLISQKEERERRFTLALRAGIPLLTLIALVFFSTFTQDDVFVLTIRDGVLLTAITFITIYFIYFLMNLSVQESLIDEATQGFNKKAFIQRLAQYKPTTLACINIENLQVLSEHYSAEQIDNLLYSITQKIHLLFKQHGLNNVLIGRQRGSEFVIALQEENQDVLTLLDKMVNQNSHINDIEIEYKFSVISNSNNDFEKMIIQLRDIIASQSLDKSQEITQEEPKDAKELSLIEKDVIHAIQNKTLLLSFRPLLNTKTNDIDTYEIAVKLKSLGNPHILPRVFLPIVNRLGLGREYDFMLTQHIMTLLPLVDERIAFTFNLSPFSLRDKGFQEKLFTHLQTTKVNPSRLIIQLYERKTHHDLSGYLKTLKDFRRKGMRICIDNFGSSNASMEYIKHFKFDVVQFDRDYVTDLNNETSYAMLQSLIKMSKDLKVITVAKWVDNDTQKDKLYQLGIDYIQGFGVSKPLNETELIQRYN
ncbi:MAG: EAL domain-containing protein [Sulfurovum sp.]|nr:EAL domain-containing protein [Sulfurovum sp.]